jgi:arabinofuranosyltransferase
VGRAPRATLGTVAALWLPLVVFAALAWQRRWMSDDGFINLRIVWNVLHGHGPVFNIGERVEAGTSPLWLAILVVARVPLFFLDAAWVAVLVGIALSLVGLAAAIVGSQRWWASLGRTASVPAGAVVLIALPSMWDFASSGLESGLSFAWLGGCWWALSRRLDAEGPPPPHDPWWTPTLIGLAVLVRPDFAVFALTLGIALAVSSTHRWRDCAKALGFASALPLAYQLFRMGYYGLLVPNTALAKEAARNLTYRGGRYVDFFLDTTLLRFSIALLVVLFVAAVLDVKPGRRHMAVALALPVAGLLHGYYVVRVGGDFMYGRLVLPGTFAVIAPAAALPAPAPNRRLLWAPAVVVAVLAAVCTTRDWAPQGLEAFIAGDERAAWIDASRGHDHPVTLDDYGRAWSVTGARRVSQTDDLVDLITATTYPADRQVVRSGAIGMVSVVLYDAHIADVASLAEPIGAHMEPGPVGRAGHEKTVPWAWTIARFAEPPLRDPDARAAREALGCGDLAELVDAVSEPLTPGRFLRNFVGATERTTLRVPRDAQEAREKFCGK